MFSPQLVNQKGYVACLARISACAISVLLLGAAPEKSVSTASKSPSPSTQSPRESGIRSAQIVSVPVPIVGTVDTTVKRQIDNIVGNYERSAARPVLIFEFQGKQGQGGEGSEFERCLSLARYIASERLTGFRTVAFIPETLRGHAVLPVLACEEIVIAEDAELGEAGLNESFVDGAVLNSYREIAERRRTIPVAVVLGMLDKKLNVYKVQTTDGVRYVLDDELKTLQQEAAVGSVETVSRSGDLAKFSGRDLRVKYGFVSHLAGDRQQLASVLNLSPGGLQQDPSLGGKWRPVQVEVRGPINTKQINWIERSLKERIAREQINFVCVVIDSAGGSPHNSLRLANWLASLDPATIRTVAFVEHQARADAALVALACDQLVIGEAASLGGPGESVINERDQEAIQSSIAVLAADKGRDWSLVAALVDPTIVVHRYTRAGSGEVRYFSDAEIANQADVDTWTRGEVVDTVEGISGRVAADVRLASFLATDMSEFQRLYHLDGSMPRLEPNWAHLFIEHLASPRVGGLLLFIALFTLMIEISQPGVGVPGFVAAVCFVLYFWSNFLHGTAGWLEVLLFIAGMTSVLVELFFLPGVGVFGIGGGLLMISSIVLASQTFIIPRNSYQLGQFPSSLMMVAAAGAGAFVSLVVIRRYLTEAPVLNRMVLAPPDEDEIVEREEREALAHLAHLIGKRGRTMTPLMPSGKARFGDDIVNVATNGEPISYECDVIAIADRGNYLLVEAADI
jgi:membrane-bound serine protease (ClpP class)